MSERATNKGERLSILLDLLDLFLDRRTPIEFRAVVERVGLERRTVYRYMQVLEARGFAERVHDLPPGRGGQKWQRGPRLTAMARRVAA
jgi:DNA-binding IclR family transcriptional regulator